MLGRLLAASPTVRLFFATSRPGRLQFLRQLLLKRAAALAALCDDEMRRQNVDSHGGGGGGKSPRRLRMFGPPDGSFEAALGGHIWWPNFLLPPDECRP